MQKLLPLFLATATHLIAAQNPPCNPTPPTTCYSTNACNCRYCLGPPKLQGNAPVRPYTCNGDFTISVSGLYWNARQDGMEYAIDNAVSIQDPNNGPEVQQINNLINAKYKTPNFKWDFGFKLGLGYNTTCDGWDVGILWTHFRGKAFSHDEAEADDNHSLILLWSDFNGRAGINTFARDIETRWESELNLVDIELGREFWTSRYLSIRPFIGIRISWIQQEFLMQNKGGSFAPINNIAFNNEVDLNNDFKGVGVRSGLDLNWHFECGFSLYSNFATSIVYGRFNIDHDELNREAESPFSKTKILETEEHFHASRAMLDLALGVQWQRLLCNCKYGFTAMLGWEQHLFFHQNQLWRVQRALGQGISLQNNTGENIFYQRRGTFSTQGWILTFKFDF